MCKTSLKVVVFYDGTRSAKNVDYKLPKNVKNNLLFRS